MNNRGLNIVEINDIIKKTIGQIDSSREQIFRIVDTLRNEYEDLKLELARVKNEINNIIEEVDTLEKQDKLMRIRLVEVSQNFGSFSEAEVKAVYDKASEIRIKFITKTNEEKALKDRRTRLEMNLKSSVDNIEAAENIINQISIALGYLEGDVLSVLDSTDRSSEMLMGIKILEAQENERKRISRDIHDGPAQHMANVVMKIDICSKIIQKDLDDGLKELADLKESVKVALKEVRNIIFDLRPMSLDDLGLNQTIQETVKAITQESNIDIQLKLRPMKSEVESIIQVAVYRIIQEIFNNIKKHSKAKHVEVKLDFGTQYLMLIITDDGIGFSVDETLKRVKTKGSSYGLIGILERVNQLQGEIHIESSEGKGTTYKVKLPVNREVMKNEKG